MADAVSMEQRGIKDGAIVYFLEAADRETAEQYIEAWKVVKGVVVGDVGVPRPRIASQEGFRGGPDLSASRQARKHPDELFTLTEVRDALNDHRYRASEGMGVPEEASHEIDELLSLAIGNYLVAGALGTALFERSDQEVASRLS